MVSGNLRLSVSGSKRESRPATTAHIPNTDIGKTRPRSPLTTWPCKNMKRPSYECIHWIVWLDKQKACNPGGPAALTQGWTGCRRINYNFVPQTIPHGQDFVSFVFLAAHTVANGTALLFLCNQNSTALPTLAYLQVSSAKGENL